LLGPPLARLHAEQAIYMVNSFQFTRSARLILATDRQGADLPVTALASALFSLWGGAGEIRRLAIAR
jgi:hypothetical protein